MLLAQAPKLVWNENPELNIVKYCIYRGVQASENQAVEWEGLAIATTNDTAWIDTSVIATKSGGFPLVYYRVSAKNQFDIESDFSNTVFVSRVNVLGVPPKVKAVESFVRLFQNYPNPFNPTTSIRFLLEEKAYITLTIYNLLGDIVKELHDGILNKGEHVFIWDGQNEKGNKVSTGIYIVSLNGFNYLFPKEKNHKTLFINLIR